MWCPAHISSRCDPFILLTINHASHPPHSSSLLSPPLPIHCSPRQVIIPPRGCRIIMASDGIWDEMKPGKAVAIARPRPAESAALELVRCGCNDFKCNMQWRDLQLGLGQHFHPLLCQCRIASLNRRVTDDTTVIVVDIMPDVAAAAAAVLEEGAGVKAQGNTAEGDIKAAVVSAAVVGGKGGFAGGLAGRSGSSDLDSAKPPPGLSPAMAPYLTSFPEMAASLESPGVPDAPRLGKGGLLACCFGGGGAGPVIKADPFGVGAVPWADTGCAPGTTGHLTFAADVDSLQAGSSVMVFYDIGTLTACKTITVSPGDSYFCRKSIIDSTCRQNFSLNRVFCLSPRRPSLA